jgi:hypothetical protein
VKGLMGKKVWFIGNGEEPKGAYYSFREAKISLETLEEKESVEDYVLYSLDLENLDEYPQEYNLLEKNNLPSEKRK